MAKVSGENPVAYPFEVGCSGGPALRLDPA